MIRMLHFVALTVLLCHGTHLFAQEVETEDLLAFSLEDLMKVKIKATTKSEISVTKSPNSVTVITYKQIQESSARTVPELLRSVGGVNVRWNPMMQTIDMRGFGQSPFTSRVLLLIDGVPYNSWNKGGFPQQPGFDFFNLQNVNRIEVIRGPSSALYGENAYWGVINIITLSGEDVDGGNVQVFGGDRETRSVNAMYGKAFQDGSFLLSAKYVQSQLPQAFWFDDNDSKVRGSDIYLKGKYKAFELSYYRHDDKTGGFESSFGGPNFPPGSVFKSADEIKQTVNILALKMQHTFEPQGLRFSGDVSFANRNGMHCGSCHALPQDPNFSQKENHGYQLIADFLMEKSLPSNNLLIGVEGRSVDSGKHGDRGLLQIDPITGENTTRDYRKLAIYVQDRLSLDNDNLHIIGGLRYDSKTYPDLFDDRLSPRLAAVYNPTEKLTFRGGWNLAFHFPDFSALYLDTWFLNLDAGDMAFPLSVFQPNTRLKPEKIQNFDFGIDYRFSSKLTAKVDVFRSTVDNFIVIAFNSPPPPETTTLTFENHPDNATIWGGELELRWDLLPGVNGFINWSYQDQEQDGNRVDSSGKPFEFVYAPQHKINIGSYFGPFSGVRGAVEFIWRDEQTSPSFWNQIDSGFTETGVGTLGDYTYLNLKLSYDLPFNAGRRKRPLRLNLYLKNLFDEQPRETLLPISTEVVGREFFVGAEYRFEL